MTGEVRCPSSDRVPPADRLVTVRLRLGRNVASSSSLSDSPSSDDSEDVMPAERKSGAVELRVGGLRGTDRRGCATVLGSNVGVPGAELDVRLRLRTWPADAMPLSRSPGIDGTGEFVALRRAWASRNAATDIRWEESLAKLSPRGRGRTGGSNESIGGESGLGEVEREEETWRKDFKLKESAGGGASAQEDGTW